MADLARAERLRTSGRDEGSAQLLRRLDCRDPVIAWLSVVGVPVGGRRASLGVPATSDALVFRGCSGHSAINKSQIARELWLRVTNVCHQSDHQEEASTSSDSGLISSTQMGKS